MGMGGGGVMGECVSLDCPNLYIKEGSIGEVGVWQGVVGGVGAHCCGGEGAGAGAGATATLGEGDPHFQLVWGGVGAPPAFIYLCVHLGGLLCTIHYLYTLYFYL